MTYLKIENKGSLDRRAVRYWGFSTKREASGPLPTIGHKGTGTNLAPLAAFRLGLDVAITSTDKRGTYLLSYESREIDIDGWKTNELFLRCTTMPEADEPSTVTLDCLSLLESSFMDWDRPIGSDRMPAFKALREFLCNAKDEGSWRFSEVDEVAFASTGTVAVYLRLTDDIRTMLAGDESRRYFKFLSKQATSVSFPGLGTLHRRSDPDNTRLFVKGVLVGCYARSVLSSLFDYSLDDPDQKLVSEEREIKNYWEYLGETAKLLARIPSEKLATRVLQAVEAGEASFEEEVIGRLSGFTKASRRAWKNAMVRVYGEKIAVASYDLQTDNDCEQIFKYRVIKPRSDSVRTFLRKMGVQKATEIVPTRESFVFERIAFDWLDKDARARFQQAFALFARFHPDRAHVPIAFFHPLSKRMQKYAAVAGIGHGVYKEIWIATVDRTSLPSVQGILASLVHDTRHCRVRAGDYDRKFIDEADRDAVAHALRCAGIFFHEDGTPIPDEDTSGTARPTFVDAGAGGPILSDDDIDALFVDDVDLEEDLS